MSRLNKSAPVDRPHCFDPYAAEDKLMDSLAWLESLKESFASTGLDYEDLYELIEASIASRKIGVRPRFKAGRVAL